ncbi:MAG: hypothetical protein Q9191_008129 [Dirinaria sp. TL-2023a]
MTQLYNGAFVNIILKADQTTGKLTQGRIANFLTRGDHPRGIKVRLTDGRIGRVQSLAPLSGSTTGTSAGFSEEASTTSSQNSYQPSPREGSRWGMAQDMRYDGYDPDSRTESPSLADYIKPQKQKRSKKPPAAVGNSDRAEDRSQQEVLEAEFPKVDNALIAAISTDYPSIEDARTVLKGLEKE